MQVRSYVQAFPELSLSFSTDITDKAAYTEASEALERS
jgi:hypothetical protein